LRLATQAAACRAWKKQREDGGGGGEQPSILLPVLLFLV
jgi:hypothetical protein